MPSYAPGGAMPAPASNSAGATASPVYAPGGASPGATAPAPSYGAPAGGTGNTAYSIQDEDKTVSFDFYHQGERDGCVPVEKLVYVDQCEPYVEKVCFTQQTENCGPIPDTNCTGTMDQFEDRMCFNVTELQCELQEVVTYDMVDETYNVQKCTQVSDRVCDTVYDLQKTSKDDFQCIDLKNNNCWDEEKMIQDVVCKYSYTFDCGKHKPQDGKGAVGCTKVPTKQCYDIPRKVKMQMCKVQASRHCDKLTSTFPYPAEKQACHSDPIKKCELETRSRPKKAKKYTYNKNCKPVVRQVCDTASRQALRAVCKPSQRITCSYAPKEKCTEENKQYCYKAEKTVVEKVCTPPKKQTIDTVTSYV